MGKCPACGEDSLEKDGTWQKCTKCGHQVKPPCACGRQIIWFFEVPTILACPKCETTHYYNRQRCSNCGTKLVEFVGVQRDIDEALAEADKD